MREYNVAKDWAVQAASRTSDDVNYETAYGYNQRGRARLPDAAVATEDLKPRAAAS